MQQYYFFILTKATFRLLVLNSQTTLITTKHLTYNILPFYEKKNYVKMVLLGICD